MLADLEHPPVVGVTDTIAIGRHLCRHPGVVPLLVAKAVALMMDPRGGLIAAMEEMAMTAEMGREEATTAHGLSIKGAAGHSTLMTIGNLFSF